jgi:hypothetical protein
MKELICKADIVEEIKRRIKTNKGCMLGLRNLDYYQGKVDALNDTISFLNTLEVKEVDLEKEIKSWLDHGHITDTRYDDYDDNDIESTAKYFFELGLKAKKGE